VISPKEFGCWGNISPKSPQIENHDISIRSGERSITRLQLFTLMRREFIQPMVGR